MSAAVLMLAATMLAGLLPPTPSPPPSGVQVGKPAPAFFVTGLDGKLVGRSVLQGRAAFVNVFATWCGPCRVEIPDIVAAYPRYKDRVTFFGVDEQEPASKVAPFVRKLHIPYQVGIDTGQMAATFGAASIPHSVFIDRHGIVRAVWSGPLTPAQLDRHMALIDGD